MGDIYIALNGGGGITSDEVTVTSANVLQGKTYVGADTDDEIGIGTMPNNPAQNVSLNCGQSVTIPLGYNPGSIITANSLASQTGGATADDSKVLSSYTYWKDGIKRTGNLSVTSVVSFNVAQYSNLTLIASWAKPSKGPWSGLRVMCKQGGYPANANDGTLFYEGSGTSATKSLASGTWYFRAWNYLTTNTGRVYGGYSDKTVSNNQVKGQQTFTSSGVFVVPANVYSIDVFCVGGGGGGATANSWVLGSNHGGGGGYTNTVKNVSVIPSQKISVSIGIGGSAGKYKDPYGKNGGTTSVNGICSASGGEGGSNQPTYPLRAGAGGSGGGASGYVKTSDYVDKASHAGVGGADGSDGAQVLVFDQNGGPGEVPRYEVSQWTGIGQHKTTRAFGENSGVLYSGGGGGGYVYNYASYSDDSATAKAAPGGSGGGGAGADAWGTAGNGSANTGGGGGAGTGGRTNGGRVDGGNGGSGIAIIRWGY